MQLKVMRYGKKRCVMKSWLKLNNSRKRMGLGLLIPGWSKRAFLNFANFSKIDFGKITFLNNKQQNTSHGNNIPAVKVRDNYFKSSFSHI